MSGTHNFCVYLACVQVGNILDEASKKLKRDINLVPIFISVDPDRDSIRQLQYYSKDFHPKIQYLTGTKEQVRR